MHISRPSMRVKTPSPSALTAEAGVPADEGQTRGTSNTAFVPATPPFAAGSETISAKTSCSHPSLIALAHLLGRQAAAHVHKYRFEGLGRITLIRLRQETPDSLNL